MVFGKAEIYENMSLREREERALPGRVPPELTHSLRRSNMMLNPLNLKHLNRLDELQADVVTLNLEDAIAPERKREALVNCALFLSHLESRNSLIVVRVNPMGEGGEEEIVYLNDYGYDAIRVSKVRRREDIARALSLLPKGKELHISLETREAFRDFSHWGDIDERFTTVNLGILDLLADLDLPHTLLETDNPLVMHILGSFLLNARIAGLEAVSFMFQRYRETEVFREWCEIEKRMGFRSKACMGPAQVEIANEIFGASEEEIADAEEICRLFEESGAKGINGFMHEKYGFIDEPIYKDALNRLARFAKTKS